MRTARRTGGGGRGWRMIEQDGDPIASRIFKGNETHQRVRASCVAAQIHVLVRADTADTMYVLVCLPA